MSYERDPNRDQPLPRPGREDVLLTLVDALTERRAYGIRKYGRPLESFNGRDAIRDAWEETLDLLAYLTQVRLERGEDLSDLTRPQQSSAASAMCRHCNHPYHGNAPTVCNIPTRGPDGKPGRRCTCSSGLPLNLV